MPHVLRCPLPLTFGIQLLVVCLCAMPAPAHASSPEPPERLEEACTGGSALACDKLGELYEEGRGVDADESHAASLYERACTGGVARGCNHLGILYQEGRGVPKDEQRAFSLYSQACTAGYPNACTNLGLLYLRGRGVEKDERQAVTLFHKSCEADRADACSLLSSLYGSGQGAARDVGRAASFAEKACALGDASSCRRAPLLVESAERKKGSTTTLWDQGPRLRLILTLGGQLGGDTLFDASFTDGSSKTIRAGDGMLFAAGGVLEPFGGRIHLLQLQATAGYNFSYVGADNAGVDWTHGSWELLAFYVYRPFAVRLGGGLQYNTGVSLEGDGGLSAYKIPFQNAAGWVVQADWHSDFFSFYARYTNVAYTPVGASAAIPASSFGFGMSWLLKIL